MNNPLDNLGIAVREAREKKRISQRALAAKLNMNVRTVIEIEMCRSNPKFETVALLARELDINLNSVISPDTVLPGTIPKSVQDFFDGKSEAEAQRYITLCEQAEIFSKK